MDYVIACLGNEPLIYGPYPGRLVAVAALAGHVGLADPLAIEGDPAWCDNGVESLEHHVERLRDASEAARVGSA